MPPRYFSFEYAQPTENRDLALLSDTNVSKSMKT